MAMGSGLLTLTMAMVAADGPSCPPVETATYQVRVLTLDGLDWRTSSYTRLQPVAHQGMSTVWTADRALASSLADRAKASSPCHTIMAVGEAVLTKAENVNYIAAMDRVADGPINQSSAIAFMPRPEQVEERFSIKVAGRKLDQGVLTKITLEETHVDVIHGVPQTETLIPAPSRVQKDAPATSAAADRSTISSITSSVQIPEITRASVCGEWLIPNDGVLLVSLGVKTAADDKGMAVVRERVAVIEACADGATGPEAKRATITAAVAPFQHVKLAQPVMPGRTMPEAIDPDGNLVDLPPLPEALASADLDRIKPDQPSPQAPIHSAPASDPALARTSFDAAPPAPKAPAEVQEFLGDDIHIETCDIVDALRKAEEDGNMGKVFMALLKAGVKFDKLPGLNASNFFPACDKCDGDATVCPATALSMKAGQLAGGMKLAPEAKPQMEITVKNAAGVQVLSGVADLVDAFRAPGRTETSLVPLGDNFALELKATVVPTTPEKNKTAKKVEAQPARR